MLYTWEDKFASLTSRVVQLDLALARIARFVESSERLQDAMNRRMAERLKALEGKTSSL